MDRQKEAQEQAALDASNRRRTIRFLLRDYIHAWVDRRTQNDPLLRSLASLRIVHNEEILRSSIGFKRFQKLRKHARTLLRGKKNKRAED